MKPLQLHLTKLLWLILLTACSQQVEPKGTTIAEVTRTTTEPTPTLIPGLPTSTPQGIHQPAPPSTATATRLFASPTPASTPTPTPLPVERLELGEQFIDQENYDAAVDQLQSSVSSDELSDSDRQRALFYLGQAQFALDANLSASQALSQYLATASNSIEAGLNSVLGDQEADADTMLSVAYYTLASTYVEQGQCNAAVRAYERYLRDNQELAAYVYPLIADCQLMLGDRQAAKNSLEAAVAAEAPPGVTVALANRLAGLYREDSDYSAALVIYEDLYNGDYSDDVTGQALYQAGTMQTLLGNFDEGWHLYKQAVMEYPTAYESYLALQALIEAGQVVEDYSRGVVDFRAQVYEPAITVLNRYVTENPVHIEDAHLYLAWSYEGLGNVEAAINQADVYLAASESISATNETKSVSQQTTGYGNEQAAQKDRGLIEKAKILLRAGLDQNAVESLRAYLEGFPDGDDGPYAAWWSASITERLGDLETAAQYYQDLASIYPEHEDAVEALYRAGLLLAELGESVAAQDLWRQAATMYPGSRFGAAATFQLLSILSEEDAATVLEELRPHMFEEYYGVRVSHIASGTIPFEEVHDLRLSSTAIDQLEAEDWLRDQLGLADDFEIPKLSETLEKDGRLVRGSKLWAIGRRAEAKLELESLRMDYADNVLASYQLALYFRDIGLYRSSILAASSLMRDIGVDSFGAPVYIGRLAYPVYYADLVLEESDRYDLDPLLLFALIRQESLFESFATSSAVAQGLAQVIPDTGQYIANELDWPNFKNEDLYRPYVGVAFGAFYLAEQIEHFDGDIPVALSAYNGGPGNAARWQSQSNGNIDQYLSIVDFGETRRYIERIYTGHAVYKYLYEDLVDSTTK